MFDHANGYLSPASAMDAEEFFQAKRDEGLGRWRWPENPEWVVYPKRPGYSAYNGADLLVINERHGSSMEYVRADDDGTEYVGLDEPAAEAARAYFEAHPERRPWENANDGDIWEFEDGQYIADRGRFFRLPLVPPTDPSWRPAGFASNFTAGSRIYPEDAS